MAQLHAAAAASTKQRAHRLQPYTTPLLWDAPCDDQTTIADDPGTTRPQDQAVEALQRTASPHPEKAIAEGKYMHGTCPWTDTFLDGAI